MDLSTYEKLKKHEGLFMTYKKVGAARPTGPALDELEVIYREECKMILNRFCGSCLGEMINRLHNLIVEFEKQPKPTINDVKVEEVKVESKKKKKK